MGPLEERKGTCGAGDAAVARDGFTKKTTQRGESGTALQVLLLL